MAYYISNIARSKGDPKVIHSGPSSLGAADRLAKALRDSRKRRGSGRASSPLWELKRIVGRLLKLLRNLRNAG